MNQEKEIQTQLFGDYLGSMGLNEPQTLRQIAEEIRVGILSANEDLDWSINAINKKNPENAAIIPEIVKIKGLITAVAQKIQIPKKKESSSMWLE